VSSYQFYVKVKGSKQGAFKGESPMVDRTDWINGVRFRFKGEIPLDPQRGLSSGLPRHDPIVVTKLWGASSPQILQAFWDAEVLDEVIIEFVEADGQGNPETVYEQITLKRAVVAQLERYSDKTEEGLTARPSREFEDVGFKAEEIVVKNLRSKTMARYAAKG